MFFLCQNKKRGARLGNKITENYYLKGLADQRKGAAMLPLQVPHEIGEC